MGSCVALCSVGAHSIRDNQHKYIQDEVKKSISDQLTHSAVASPLKGQSLLVESEKTNVDDPVAQQNNKTNQIIKLFNGNDKIMPSLSKNSLPAIDQQNSRNSQGRPRIQRHEQKTSLRSNASRKKFRQMTEHTENNSSRLNKIDSIFSSQNLSQNYIQTPSNRKIDNQEGDMRGKGLKQEDNAYILETINFSEPRIRNEIKFTNMSKYTGEWQLGMRHGKGTLVWADGSKYQGEWRNNKSEGKGKLTLPDGQYYEGSWIQNQRSGFGQYFYSDGSVYTGGWQNDLQEGQGTQSWKNGQAFVGIWTCGLKNGYGELTFEDGSYYKGNFCNNELHGKGVYSWTNKKMYNGDWQHNQMNGKGLLSFIDGSKYEGQFKNEKMHGNGAYFYPDGTYFMGTWQRGRKNGIIIEKDTYGRIRQSQWYIGKRLRYLDEMAKPKRRKKMDTGLSSDSVGSMKIKSA